MKWRWRSWVLLCTLGFASGVRAQADAGAPQADAGQASTVDAEVTPPPAYIPNEPGTQYVAPAAPSVGACLGGRCAEPSLSDLARVQPFAIPQLALRRSPLEVTRRERFAKTGAVFGVVSAGLVLGGAIAIAAVDDPASERVTRGIWLGYVSVSVPLVAFSVWLAQRESKYEGYRAVRSFGWLSWALAVGDGAFMWSNAFQHESSSRLLTVSAGAFGVLALLPHALEAMNAARSIHIKSLNKRLRATGSGFAVKF